MSYQTVTGLNTALAKNQATSGVGTSSPIGFRAELGEGVIKSSGKPIVLYSGCDVYGQGPSTVCTGDVLIGCKQTHGYTTNVTLSGMQINGNIRMDASATNESHTITLRDLIIFGGSIDFGTATRYMVNLQNVRFMGPFTKPIFKGNVRIGSWQVHVQGANKCSEPLIQFTGDQNMVVIESSWFETTGGGAILSCIGTNSRITESGNWWELHGVVGPQAIYSGVGTELVGRVPHNFLNGEDMNPIAFLDGAKRVREMAKQ